MFTLINIESATLLSERITMDDGRKAARAARLLSLKTKQRFQPRKIESATVDTAWHKREEERFLSGEYIPLASELTIAANIFETKTNSKLFAHISKKNPSLIAYTKDAIKGAQDKQSLLSIEAFVKLVCPNNSQEIHDYLIKLQTNHAKAHAPQPFKLATTPDDIEQVYTNYDESKEKVAGSCMRYGRDELNFSNRNWPKVNGERFQPVRVYGAGDIAVAYMTNGDGETIARALCWPDKKLYSRMYADNDSLHNALQAAGYEKSYYYNSDKSKSFIGARLLKIESDNGELIAPYLDELGYIDDSGDYLTMTSYSEHECRELTGTVKGEPEPTPESDESCCEHCGDSYDADDLTMVYTDSRQRSGEAWCDHCRSNNAFYCEGEREYFSDSVDHTIVNDEYYTSRYAENYASYCDYYEEYTFGDLTTVIVDSDGETQNWSEGAIESHAYKYNGDYYSDDVDYERVITERYALRLRFRFSPIYSAINAWFTDVTQKIPTHLIDEGSVDVVEAANGRYYLKDYVDHYPVERERLDVVDAIIVESIAA